MLFISKIAKMICGKEIQAARLEHSPQSFEECVSNMEKEYKNYLNNPLIGLKKIQELDIVMIQS